MPLTSCIFFNGPLTRPRITESAKLSAYVRIIFLASFHNECRSEQMWHRRILSCVQNPPSMQHCYRYFNLYFFSLKYFTCIHKRKTTLKTVMAKLAWTTVISSHERWLSTILAYRVKSLLHIIHV